VTTKQTLDTFDVPRVRDFLLLTGAFATGLCWWIGMTAFVNAGGLASGGAGFVLFLSVPLIATFVIYRALRRRNASGLAGSESTRGHGSHRRSGSGRHSRRFAPEPSGSRGVNGLLVLNRPAMRDFLVIIAGLVTVLCWWIGMTAYMNAGGLAHLEALVFLIVPVLATAGTFLAARQPGSGSRS
jgi:hypothetical protein